MSVEFTKLIDQLRTSLFLAIVLGILFLGIATRSPLIMLAAITPNLLPIFFVLFFLFLRGGTINLSEVVALTVAFGIAIDNAVHLINVYDNELKTGKQSRHALALAMEEAGPALAAGTVIICVSVLVTQISSLPVVPTLGHLIISTLIVALFGNLIMLPANILTLTKFTKRS
jgi:predicted RND superfamily exporter protein